MGWGDGGAGAGLISVHWTGAKLLHDRGKATLQTDAAALGLFSA